MFHSGLSVLYDMDFSVTTTALVYYEIFETLLIFFNFSRSRCEKYTTDYYMNFSNK